MPRRRIGRIKVEDPGGPCVFSVMAAVGSVRIATDVAAGHVAALDAKARAELVTEVEAAIRDLRAIRRALAGELRTCEACGAKFIGRADARFHNDACRQRAHRTRDA